MLLVFAGSLLLFLSIICLSVSDEKEKAAPSTKNVF